MWNWKLMPIKYGSIILQLLLDGFKNKPFTLIGESRMKLYRCTDGIGWMDGSPGGPRYRAPYSARLADTFFTRPLLPEGSSLQVEILSVCPSSLQYFQYMVFKSSQNHVRPHISYIIGKRMTMTMTKTPTKTNTKTKTMTKTLC